MYINWQEGAKRGAYALPPGHAGSTPATCMLMVAGTEVAIICLGLMDEVLIVALPVLFHFPISILR